ncbi:MAG: hypothetical protein ACI8W8_004283, partial [Rhodothermales bacterium]
TKRTDSVRYFCGCSRRVTDVDWQQAPASLSRILR